MPVKSTVALPVKETLEIEDCNCEPVTSATETASTVGSKKAIPNPVGLTIANPSAVSSPILDCNWIPSGFAKVRAPTATLSMLDCKAKVCKVGLTS